MSKRPHPDLLDRRQRLAAALLLSAIDLPASAAEWAKQGAQAASVCPGLLCGELDVNGGRLAQLRTARGLLDEMIAEASS